MLSLRQEARRRRDIAAAIEEFQQLRVLLAGSKTRLRGTAEIDLQIKVIIEKHHVARYLKVRRTVREEHEYRQTRRGRPGPETAYRKITKWRFDIEWTTDEQAINYDHSSDGMYPLVTNDRSLSPAQVLEAHKGQPMIEKRFEQIKSVQEIARVFLKDEGRIEAFFTLYFLALLVRALIERELRLAMKREDLDELPLYPEQRRCARPTTELTLRLFSHAERHRLIDGAHTVQVFDVPLTELQRQLLRLRGVPEDAFCTPN
ncbi:Transposase [Caballeronia sordidicola]|uniref:Transposase n=1 Tax=Caballeronia sordidicola TaxID=196367 RepID=A0A226XAA8_CABSO|nr:hypothetical protein [Caballeronia sordidicola]OXC80426.1 Transposase [Caballeronia sordidicola]